MCDKSRNTWLCVHWQWNTREWCQLNALLASPVVHLVTPLSCDSLSMNTQPSVPTIYCGNQTLETERHYDANFVVTSVVAPFITTIDGPTSDDKVGIMTTLFVQWLGIYLSAASSRFTTERMVVCLLRVIGFYCLPCRYNDKCVGHS